MKEKEKIIDTYQKEEIAETFDKERNEFLYLRYKHQLESGILKSSLKNLINPKVLDVGCGTGRMLSVVFEANNNAGYFGLDTSKAMISVLNKKASSIGKKKEIKVIIGDATKIPFKNDVFDVVFTYHLLWHLPFNEQEKIILEMLRVCKKDGIIIFDILNKDFIWEKIKSFLGRKKTGGIYKTSIAEIKKIIGNREIKIDKLSDAYIKNSLIYSLYNVINLLRKILPNNLYHMIYIKIKK